jgi:DNA modification methylase
MKLFNDDCLKVLPIIPDKSSVDLILTAPPYNLGTKHHTGNGIVIIPIVMMWPE